MSDITIGALSLPGANFSNVGADFALSGVTVTLNDDQVTGSNFLPASVVGMGGFKITLAGTTCDVESVESRSALTLTAPFSGSSGTVSGTLHKFVQLRIYAQQSFIPSGSSETVQAGIPGSNSWFRRYGASIIHDGVQNVLFLPEITLPATTNSSQPFARWNAGLYSQGGSLLENFPTPITNFRLGTTTPTSWAQIIAFNSAIINAPPAPVNFYTQAEIDARFPSGLADQLLYFENTGNVLTPLTLSAEFDITSDTLSLTNPAVGYDQMQEEGSNLAKRRILNFVGSSFTAADDLPNLATVLTADADLNAIASNSTNGIYARTGAGTMSARTITGPAAGITVSNGDGVAGNPTLALANNLAALEAINTTGFIAQTGADTVTPRTITGTANRIGVTNGDGVAGNPTLDIGSDVVTLTGSQTLTNKTLTSPRIGTAILDTNGNEMISLSPTGSAVNQIRVINNTTGNPAFVTAFGDDASVGLVLASQVAGALTLQTNTGTDRVVVHGTNAELYLGDGITSATPDSFVINGSGGSGTNIAGARLDLAGGKGTGNAVPGQVAVRYPLRTASGTTLQGLSAQGFPVSTSLYTNTSNGTAVSNTTTETSLFTGATASAGSTLTIEAGSPAAGSVYRLRLDAPYTTTGTPTLRLRIKLGSTSVGDTTAFNATTGTANGRSFVEAYIFVDSVGASGSVRAELFGNLMPTPSGTATPAFFVGSLGAVTIDFTANQTIDVSAQWGTASASNTITMQRASIERIR